MDVLGTLIYLVLCDETKRKFRIIPWQQQWQQQTCHQEGYYMIFKFKPVICQAAASPYQTQNTMEIGPINCKLLAERKKHLRPSSIYDLE